MAMKEWFRQMQPVQLYLMLGLTLSFFAVEMFMSHMTHALTLLVDAYHTLCNLIALVGCIITIKYGSANLEREDEESSRRSVSVEDVATDIIPTPASSCYIHNVTSGCNEHHPHRHYHSHSSEEKRLKNTFGWARIDVLVMLIGCVFLASLCFSLLVEALQTLLHIEHHDEMHHPIPVMCIGATGLLLNGLCFLMIGGFTFHQGSFLHITPSGDVVLDRAVTEDSLKKGQRRLSAESRQPATPPHYPQRQGIRETCRDIMGCVVVIICSLIVYFTDENVAKYVDPILSIVSAVLLLILSYPYMKESGLILLQTIPDTINIDSLCSELVKAFPDIVNVHDLHIWRLTPTRIFSTAHIIFLNSKDYIRITKEITDFFHDQGITHVTVQPEFLKADNTNNLTELPNRHSNHCLVQCRELGCHSRHCCSHNQEELETVTVGSNHHHHSHSNSHHHSKNHKKNHAATRVKELVTHKKSTKTENSSDRASACNINMSFESEIDSRVQSSEDVRDGAGRGMPAVEKVASASEQESEIKSEQSVDTNMTAESTSTNEMCSNYSGITNTDHEACSAASEQNEPKKPDCQVPSQTEAVLPETVPYEAKAETEDSTHF